MHLFESELSETKNVKISLISIYGLNFSSSQKIIKKIGFSNNFKMNRITNEQIVNLVQILNSLNLKVSNELRKYNFSIFKTLVDLKSIKSYRLNKGLPVRGQRTHTNAKTSRKKLYFATKIN